MGVGSERGESRARAARLFRLARFRAAADGTRARDRGRVAQLAGYLSVLFGSAAARLSSFVVTVILARALGPSQFGEFSLFFAFMAPLALTTDFIDVTYARHANDGQRQNRPLLRNAIAVKVGIIALLCVAAYPAGYAIAHYALDRPKLTVAIAVAVATGGMLGFVSLKAYVFLAVERFLAFSLYQSLFYVSVMVALATIWAATQRVSLGVVYLVFLIAAVLLGGISLVSLLRTTAHDRFSRRVVVDLLSFARWLFAANVVNVVGQRIDLIVVAHFVDNHEVGIYGAALRLAVIGSLLIGALSGFLLPRVARALLSREALLRYIRESLAMGLLIAAGVFAIWLAAPYLATGLFGSAFATAAGVGRIILIGTLFTCVSAPLGRLLLAPDVPRLIVFIGLAQVIVVLATTVVLAPWLGATGAAWGYAAGEAVVLAAVLVFTWTQWLRLSAPREAVGSG